MYHPTDNDLENADEGDVITKRQKKLQKFVMPFYHYRFADKYEHFEAVDIDNSKKKKGWSLANNRVIPVDVQDEEAAIKVSGFSYFPKSKVRETNFFVKQHNLFEIKTIHNEDMKSDEEDQEEENEEKDVENNSELQLNAIEIEENKDKKKGKENGKPPLVPKNAESKKSIDTKINNDKTTIGDHDKTIDITVSKPKGKITKNSEAKKKLDIRKKEKSNKVVPDYIPIPELRKLEKARLEKERLEKLKQEKRRLKEIKLEKDKEERLKAKKQRLKEKEARKKKGEAVSSEDEDPDEEEIINEKEGEKPENENSDSEENDPDIDEFGNPIKRKKKINKTELHVERPRDFGRKLDEVLARTGKGCFVRCLDRILGSYCWGFTFNSFERSGKYIWFFKLFQING